MASPCSSKAMWPDTPSQVTPARAALTAPGSVLPNNAFIFSLLSGSLDNVKDAMLFSEPLLNPVWLVCELAFCVLACGFIVLMGRYDNEIEG